MPQQISISSTWDAAKRRNTASGSHSISPSMNMKWVQLLAMKRATNTFRTRLTSESAMK